MVRRPLLETELVPTADHCGSPMLELRLGALGSATTKMTERELSGGAKPLNSDPLHGLAEVQQQPTGEVGEAGRAAHEGGRVRQH
jgi:hypothetical protein